MDDFLKCSLKDIVVDKYNNTLQIIITNEKKHKYYNLLLRESIQAVKMHKI